MVASEALYDMLHVAAMIKSALPRMYIMSAKAYVNAVAPDVAYIGP